MILVTKAHAGNVACTESKGKKYYTIDLLQDGCKVETLSCDESLAGKVKRFEKYNFTVRYEKQEFQGKVYSRIMVVDATPTN